MERLAHKGDKFIRTLDALKRSMQFFVDQQPIIDKRIEEILLSALVKHFELCYEMAWKFLKQFLDAKHEVIINSPKKIFRECFALEIIDEKITQELLAMSEARNATIHDYNEETAREIRDRITGYIATFEVLKQIYASP